MKHVFVQEYQRAMISWLPESVHAHLIFFGTAMAPERRSRLRCGGPIKGLPELLAQLETQLLVHLLLLDDQVMHLVLSLLV